MALKVVKRNKLPVRVTGSQKDEDGKMVPFDFTLHCTRLTQDEIDEAMADRKESLKAFMQRVTTGWETVIDESNQAIPFSKEAFEGVLSDAGMPLACFQCYMKDVGAVVKN